MVGDRRLWDQISRAVDATSIAAAKYSSTCTLKPVVWPRSTTRRLGKKIRFSLCWAQSELQSKRWV